MRKSMIPAMLLMAVPTSALAAIPAVDHAGDKARLPGGLYSGWTCGSTGYEVFLLGRGSAHMQDC